jgi:predicted unusual protein kinase regulating ubiquinone biosynthesis (AarF/ABC1/UbiB family)
MERLQFVKRYTMLILEKNIFYPRNLLKSIKFLLNMSYINKGINKLYHVWETAFPMTSQIKFKKENKQKKTASFSF